MGFSNILKRNAVNEWKDYYVDYDKLRTKIKSKDFKSMLYAEVNKINSFFFLLEKKAVTEKHHLFNGILTEIPCEDASDAKTQDSSNDEPQANINAFGKSTNESGNDARQSTDEHSLTRYIPLKRGYTKRKKEKLITEFLHSLVKIKAYRDLNSSGLTKLAKRYSEIFHNEVFFDKFNQKLKETYFYNSKRIDNIRSLVKKTYKATFAKDQPEKAKSILKRIGRSSRTLDIFYMLSGVASGITYTMSFQYDSSDPQYKFIWGINNCYLGFLMFGLCLKLFKFYLINYKFIFNFDVVSSMNNAVYLLFISSLLLLSNIVYTFKSRCSVIDPMTLISLIPVVFLFNPFDTLCLNSRIYFMSAFGRGLCMPISTVRFRHFYFVDVLQSFKFPIEVVFLYFFANYKDNHLYAKYFFLLLPGIRILQCLKRFITSRLPFPHIANACKYLLVFLFLFLDILDHTMQFKNNNFDVVINIVRLMSTVASFTWDLLIDWVIFRDRYMFPKGFYTGAVILNFIARFFWTKRFLVQLINPNGHYTSTKPNAILESIAEITRRFIWSLIRVEVEHLNNCDELKVNKSINLTSGEFFYKKDIEDSHEVCNNETEFETEMEENIIYKNKKKEINDLLNAETGVETESEDNVADKGNSTPNIDPISINDDNSTAEHEDDEEESEAEHEDDSTAEHEGQHSLESSDDSGEPYSEDVFIG